jgi:predicted dehydrogenase
MAHSGDAPPAVRWGILATGGIATAFAEDLALLPDAELTAVGSRSPEAARAFAQAHHIPRAYGSWAELAADPEVDVIYVATPHSAHSAATKLCLRAGKAVLCEKPFTLDLASSRELVATATEAGLFLMEAMWMRTNPAIRRIGQLIADGAIGDVVHISADFCIQGPIAPGHRLRAPELGGGALLDLGVYPVTFAHLFLGPPASIAATASLTPEGTDQNTAVVFGYESGAVATVSCGFVGESSQQATITGSHGRIEVPRHFYRPAGFTLVRENGEREGERERFDLPVVGHGYGYEAAEVMRCLRAGLLESQLVPHADTLAIMSTLDEVRALIGVSYE